MKKHAVWQPHVDRDPLYNPFIPSEHVPRPDHIELAEAYGEEIDGEEVEEIEKSASSGEAPSKEGEAKSDQR